MVEDGAADLCRDDPGHELTLIVESSVRALTEIWTGDSDPKKELSAKRIRVAGVERDARALWRWIGQSTFAPTRAAAAPQPTH